MIYQILPEYFDYKSLRLTENCRIKLHQRREEARKLGIQPTASLIYDKLEVEWYDDPELEFPDISHLSGNLVVNVKTLELIKNILPGAMQIIPCRIDGIEWFILELPVYNHAVCRASEPNVLALAAHSPDPEAVLEFDSTIQTPALFCISEPDDRFFCTEQFKVIIRQNNLTGIKITPDLVTKDYQLAEMA